MYKSHVINFGLTKVSGPFYTLSKVSFNNLDFKNVEIKVLDINDKHIKTLVLSSDKFKNNKDLFVQSSKQYPYFDLIANSSILYTQKYVFKCQLTIIYNKQKTEKEIKELYNIDHITHCDK